MGLRSDVHSSVTDALIVLVKADSFNAPAWDSILPRARKNTDEEDDIITRSPFYSAPPTPLLVLHPSYRKFVQDTTMVLLNERLHGHDVVQAAMLDLLTSQCDRHSQNVFINENGAIKLIDNLQV